MLLIDFQTAFDDPRHGPRNTPDAETNARLLLEAWRRAGRTVIHIQHSSTEPDSPLRPGHPGHAFKAGFEPAAEELRLTKTVNSAFIGTELGAELNRLGHHRLLIAGLTTDHCVSTTTRMAANLGFQVTLVADACATFDRPDPSAPHTTIDAETAHQVNLASLEGEFCRLTTARAQLTQPG